MTLRHLSVDTDAAHVSRMIDDETDGTFEVVAVEIFDHPTSRHSKLHDGTIGPWVLGPRNAVERWLAQHGYEDYTVQYSAGRDPDHFHECRRCGTGIPCFYEETDCTWEGDNVGCPNERDENAAEANA